MDITYTEREQDYNAHIARVQILGVNLGYTITKFVFRALQALNLYPKA